MKYWPRFLCLWTAITGAMAIPLSVNAHAQLVRSQPADGAALTNAPNQIELWFNELLEDEVNTIVVSPVEQVQGKEKKNLTDGKPKVDPQDRTHVKVTLKPLPPGEYIVQWRVLSRDGHSAPGKIRFRVSATR